MPSGRNGKCLYVLFCLANFQWSLVLGRMGDIRRKPSNSIIHFTILNRKKFTSEIMLSITIEEQIKIAFCYSHISNALACVFSPHVLSISAASQLHSFTQTNNCQIDCGQTYSKNYYWFHFSRVHTFFAVNTHFIFLLAGNIQNLVLWINLKIICIFK